MIDDVYDDRNLLALLVAYLARDAGMPVGWLGDPAEPEYPALYIELPTGQISFHLPHHMLELNNLPDYSGEWDYHTAEEKRDRIRSYLQSLKEYSREYQPANINVE